MSEPIETVVIRLLADAQGKSISPADVARAIAGRDEKAWSKLMPAVRVTVIALADEGRVVALRKGKPANARTLKGVYRISLAVPQAPPPSA